MTNIQIILQVTLFNEQFNMQIVFRYIDNAIVGVNKHTIYRVFINEINVVYIDQDSSCVLVCYFNKISHFVYIFKIKRYKDNNNFREASKQNDIFKIKHFILSSLASHLTILQRIKEENMDADKITLGSYIAYLKSMYKRYGNISITQLKHIERNRKKENQQ